MGLRRGFATPLGVLLYIGLKGKDVPWGGCPPGIAEGFGEGNDFRRGDFKEYGCVIGLNQGVWVCDRVKSRSMGV